MAKETKIINDCSICEKSIHRENKLYCTTMIQDLTKPFGKSAIVKQKENCSYYKVKR